MRKDPPARLAGTYALFTAIFTDYALPNVTTIDCVGKYESFYSAVLIVVLARGEMRAEIERTLIATENALADAKHRLSRACCTQQSFDIDAIDAIRSLKRTLSDLHDLRRLSAGQTLSPVVSSPMRNRSYLDFPALVVDDMATMRTLLVGMLQRLGFHHVDEAANGEQALAKLATRHFSLIVSDWNMQPIDGLELLREVRRMQTSRLNRFIFVTSQGSWGRQTTARIEHADAFISSPFTFEQLRRKVDQVMSSAA